MATSPESQTEDRRERRNRHYRNASFIGAVIFDNLALLGLAFGFELLRGSAERKRKAK